MFIFASPSPCFAREQAAWKLSWTCAICWPKAISLSSPTKALASTLLRPSARFAAVWPLPSKIHASEIRRFRLIRVLHPSAEVEGFFPELLQRLARWSADEYVRVIFGLFVPYALGVAVV